ncbi:MAG TPA: glycosyltransferase family 1 protein [Vicinamibacterales bacterium]|nr:glycosyltransferase family 1 protein [Vicinamibacterales bacterium]
MRIAIDCRELVGRPTGVGRYLSELLNAWGEMPGAGAHEFVLCAPERLNHSSFGGLRVSCLVSPGSGTLWEQRALPKLVASAGADVLFSPAYTCPLWCRAPIVLVIHDVSFAAHPEWFSWREGLRRRTLTRLGARRAARVITESDFSKREITRLLGIASSDIDVIYLGASTLKQPAATSAERRPTVLFVGSIFNRRHIPEIVEGFGRLAARVPDARLEIVGDNRTTPRIDMDQLIAASGVPDRVHWRSYISDADLAALYATASAFVFLSDYEGFGLTPIEAMAAGIPIVVLDTEISREIYGPAAAYLTRPDPGLIAAALERVLTVDGERSELIDAGSQQVERYSWRECAHRTLQVLLSAR